MSERSTNAGSPGQPSLFERIEMAVAAIRDVTELVPEVGVILGTGLGGLASEVQDPVNIPYEEIPHFPRPKVESHSGNLILGTIGGRPVVTMEGRCHYYEGYSLDQLTLPVRVMKGLGIGTLVVSSASGGVNPHFEKGDLLILDDHINFMGDNPLIGPNDGRLGPRFPDMCAPYDPELIRLAEAIALEEGIRVHRGVYAALPGPCLETRAEYRFLKICGADSIGMSTVPEVIVAVHAGLKVFGISCITDLCLPDALEPVSVEEIIAVAKEAEPKMTLIVRRLVQRCA